MRKTVYLDVPDEVIEFVEKLTNVRPISNDVKLSVEITSLKLDEELKVELFIPNIDNSFVSIYDWRMPFDPEIAQASKSDDVIYYLNF